MISPFYIIFALSQKVWFFSVKLTKKRAYETKRKKNIYGYIIKELLHWLRWILALVVISTDVRKLATIVTDISAITLYYYINIKWLKICDKSRATSVPISFDIANIIRYRNTYLISARLLGCLCMLPLHDVAVDDVERPQRRAKNCHTLSRNLTLTL